MQQIQKAIADLNEIVNKINSVSIIALDEIDFERLLAKVYGVINHYWNERESKERALEVIRCGHRILETMVRHHISRNFPATVKAVHIFEETTKLLLNIINRDFQINATTYEQALSTKNSLRALKVCGILPPGQLMSMSSSRWANSDSEKHRDEQALKFASENIVDFTRFVYDIATSPNSFRDPFSMSPEQFTIYEEVSALTPSAILLADKHTPVA